MELVKGSVVRSAAGHDKGGFFAVVTLDGGYVYIADGRERLLSHPKKKNIRHIRPTKGIIDLEGITDKGLRNILKEYSERL